MDEVDALITNNLKLVPYVIHKYLGGFQNRYEFEDLVGYGNLGLVKAAQNFNPEFGVKFATYAVSMIYGEIRRFLRDNQTVHFARPIKELHYRVVTEGLNDKDPQAIAAALEVSVEDVLDALAYGDSKVLASIDEPVFISGDGEGILRGDTLGVNQDFDSRLIIEDICNTLRPKENLVFRMYYLEETSQSKIAAEVGISQAQVSRILKALKPKVRKYLEESGDMLGGRPLVGDHKEAKNLLRTTDMTASQIHRITKCPEPTIYKYKRELEQAGELFKADVVEPEQTDYVTTNDPNCVSRPSVVGTTITAEIQPIVATPAQDISEPVEVGVIETIALTPTASLQIALDGCNVEYKWLETIFSQVLNTVKAFNLPLINYSICIHSGESEK